MQSPPQRTAKDLFLHMVDEARLIIKKSILFVNNNFVLPTFTFGKVVRIISKSSVK